MKRLFVFSMMVALAACSPQINVYSDYDPDYDLWVYKTFDWGKKVNIETGENPFHYNELNDKRIKVAVLEQMRIRGYALNSENPELTLHYHIIIDDRSIVTTEEYDYHYSPYWMRMETNVYSYREGTLILDLMDKKTNNLIWRGWAVTAINEINPEKVDGLIRKTVEKIFKKFPESYTKIQKSKILTSN